MSPNTSHGFRRSRRIRAALLGALAAAVVGSTVAAPLATAETGPPRSDSKVTVLWDSTPPDNQHDGIIPTYDLARYRIDVSQNGADSVGDVVSVVTLGNGVFVDANPNTDDFDLPTRCRTGSSVSTDRTTLTCNLGPLTQGTSVAFEYEASASSATLKNGDLLTTSVTTNGQEVTGPSLTIQGTPRVDVVKSNWLWAQVASGTRQGLKFSLQVRNNGASGKGALPLTSVTFIEDWSDLLDKLPSATATLTTVDIAPYYNTAGDWTIAPGPTPGTSRITVTNLSATPDTNGYLAGTGFQVMFNKSDATTTRQDVTNTVTNVVGTTSAGTDVAETVTSNNSATNAVYTEATTGGLNGVSGWIDSSSDSMLIHPPTPAAFKPVAGNFSSYLRGVGSPDTVSSTGLQQVFAGQTVIAESAVQMAYTDITTATPDFMTCTKFTTPVTVTGDAEAMAERTAAGPLIPQSDWQLLPTVTPTIQYSTNASPAAAGNCTDGTWTTTRPASGITAVRAFADMTAIRSTLVVTHSNANIVLRVPVTVPTSLTPGALVRFHNVAVDGDWATAPAASTIDEVLGTSGSTLYDSTNNTGNPRFGDRLLVGRGIVDVDKSVCDQPAGTVVAALGSEVDYCITIRAQGTAALRNITVTDDGGLGIAGNPITYKAGSASVTGATASSTEPAINTGTGVLTWTLPTIPLAGGNVTNVVIRYTAEVAPDAEVGSTHENVATVSGADLPTIPAGTSTAQNPQTDDQVVVLEAGEFQLHVSKSTTSPSVTYPDTAIPWDLSFTNQGTLPIGTVDVIDVLPYNGDASVPRDPASTFHGTTGLTGPVTATATQTISYTTAAPAGISVNANDPSNQSGGATTWSTTPPADLSTVTAIRVVDTATLEPAASRTITVPMATKGNKAGDIYTNDVGAVVQSGSDGPVLAIRSNDVTVTVQAPGLAIVKHTTVDANGDPVRLAPDSVNTWTIDYSNDGKLPARNTVITDVLRPGLTLVDGSISDAGTYDAATRTITWNVGTVAVDGSGTRTFRATVDRPVNAGLLDDTGRIPNTATIRSTDDCQPTAGEERCESTVTNPTGNPHLWQGKVVDHDEALPKDKLVWTLTAGNDGETKATKVVIADKMPAETTYDSSSPEKGTIVDNGDGTLTWTIGDLAPGETVTAKVTGSIKAGEWDKSFFNRLQVSHDPSDCTTTCTPPTVKHPCTDDATWSCAPTKTPQPSLRQAKVVDNESSKPGDTRIWTITVTNDGPVTASGYKVLDKLPAGVTPTKDGISNAGVYNASDRTITWTGLPDLAPGAKQVLTVKTTVDAGQWSKTLENRVEVTPPADWPPTNVEHPCTDAPSWSCAVTKTPAPPAPPTTTTTTVPPTTVRPSTPPTTTPLVRTGSNAGPLAAAGLTLVLLGAVISLGVGVRRRRGNGGSAS